MEDYIGIVRVVPCRPDKEDDSNSPLTTFALRDASKLRKIEVGRPLFQYEHRQYTIEAFIPDNDDMSQLTRAEQSWLLVDIPCSHDYTTYAWAAVRPPRREPWEVHAQARSDGYFSPASWIPIYPEPEKNYKRRPGKEFTNCSGHPSKCARIRLLVRLSDALTCAALDRTQDWFLMDLPVMEDDVAFDTVGDLLMFVVAVVGNDRLRPGHLALSAGRPNGRLWQGKTPLLVLWDHLFIASLKPTREVPAFGSLHTMDSISTLGKAGDTFATEGEYIAMAAVHSLPEWVTSDEHDELRKIYGANSCRLPHQELPEEPPTTPLTPVVQGAKQTSRRKPARTALTGSASSSTQSSATAAPQSRGDKKVTFQ